MPGFKIRCALTPNLVELRGTNSLHQGFYVHRALVDELCHPLCDELREYWEVFDEETVGRFAQYLYQADCDFPIAILAGTRASTGAASGGLNYPPTPVSLALAKLYALSYSQGIYELSDICISRLRMELDDISPPPPPPADRQVLESVVKLLRYVYCFPRDGPSPKPLQPAWMELQNLVSQFCALNIDLMEGNQGFKALLGEAGPLAGDIMAKAVRRLRPAEAALTRANGAAALVETTVAGYLLEQPRQRTPHPEEDLEQPHLEQPRWRTPHPEENLEQPYLGQPRWRTPHPEENLEQPYLEQPRRRTPQLGGLEKPYVGYWQPQGRTTPQPVDFEQSRLEQPRQRTPYLEENLEQPYLEQTRQRIPQLGGLEKPYVDHWQSQRRTPPQLVDFEQLYPEQPRQRTPERENLRGLHLERPRPQRRANQLGNSERPYLVQPRQPTPHLEISERRRRLTITIAVRGSGDVTSTYEAVSEDKPEGERRYPAEEEEEEEDDEDRYSTEEDGVQLPGEFGEHRKLH